MSEPNTPEIILAQLVPTPEGCLVWTRWKVNGYGVVTMRGKHLRVHRIAYEYHFGPIPEGLEIDHLCRNPACARADHLEAVTKSENIRRGDGPAKLATLNRSKGCCPKGHAYSGENLYVRPDGARICRTCRIEWKARKRAERGAGQSNRSKTHCKYGHPLEGENLYMRPDGKRQCKSCQKGRGRGARGA